MFDYDIFEIGNTSIGTSSGTLGKDNSSTKLTVPSYYRMKTKWLDIYNTGTTTAFVTLQKSNGTNTYTLIYKNLAASGSPGDTLIFDERHPFTVEPGYWLQANVSTGSASIFAEAELIPE
jgi:hypothetical protein